jgi:DNA-directed RNA polymerase specialized sigma24 family protein
MQGEDSGAALTLAWARPRDARPVSSVARASEQEIVEQARSGDRAAWDSLIARHDHRVVLSLLARGVRLVRARELAQQAWMRLFAQHQAGRLDRLELPGLAIRQAAFLAADEVRQRRPEAPGAASEAELASLADPAASIEERLIHRDALRRAVAELERCSPAARRVFDFVYANPDMRHATAARALGLSVQRVRQILCEVRARLRAAIEREDSND